MRMHERHRRACGQIVDADLRACQTELIVQLRSRILTDTDLTEIAHNKNLRFHFVVTFSITTIV